MSALVTQIKSSHAARRQYYHYERPTRPSPSLPPQVEFYLRTATPSEIRKTITGPLNLRDKGERFDTHPAIQLTLEFPDQQQPIVGGRNRKYFEQLVFDWSQISNTRLPQCIVMCPPTHYFNQTVDYAINKWMVTGYPVSREVATRQWQILHDEINPVLPVDTISPLEHCRDMVFVDQGLALPAVSSPTNLFIPSAMKCPERRREVTSAIDFFQQRNYEIRPLAPLLQPGSVPTFESNGDVHLVPGKALLFAGFGGRTSIDVIPALAEITDYTIIPLQMDQHQGAYHLDTASSVIDSTTALIYPEGFNPFSLALFMLFFRNIYLVSDTEAVNDFIPNSKQIKNTFFTQTSVNEQFLRFLQTPPTSIIQKIIEVDMSEFNKSGGGINCCSKLAFHNPNK